MFPPRRWLPLGVLTLERVGCDGEPKDPAELVDEDGDAAAQALVAEIDVVGAATISGN